jgi:hypothetical protein
MSTTRRTAALVATLAASASVLTMAPADAAPTADAAKSRITVRASDYEVDPGAQFVLRGRMISDGDAVEGARVRVQAYRDGGWHNLRGAVVSTNDEGRYRVRVVLSSGGDRDLRVVGNPAGDTIRNARGYTVVRVLG